MNDHKSMGLPLEGIRILELGAHFVLPLAILPLAGMGADVIKIESESRPEATRWGPQPDNQPREDAYNHGGNFHMLNRNKRAVTIDLTKPKGQELFLRLVAVSDVVAENFTPRVLRNLGLTYDRLREVNPRIILLSSCGFGQTGPWQNYKAYGPVTEAVDGLMLLTGYRDGPPQRGGSGGLGVTFPDVAGAYFGAFAILAALEQRERTGRGQWLDLAHYEAGIATIPEAVIDYTMNGRVQERRANRHPWRAPQGAYRCARNGEPGAEHRGDQTPPPDDRWIAISVATDGQFAALAEVLGLPGLPADQRFATLPDRHRNHDALDAVIAAATRDRDAEDLERELQAAGVDAAVVATPRDVWLDSQLKHRGFVEMVPAPESAPEVGPRAFVRPGWKMSVTTGSTRRPAPEFGRHTREVLAEYLALGDAELEDLLAELAAAGVIADHPRPGVVARDARNLSGMLASGLLQGIDPDYRRRLHEHLTGGKG